MKKNNHGSRVQDPERFLKDQDTKPNEIYTVDEFTKSLTAPCDFTAYGRLLGTGRVQVEKNPKIMYR